MWNQPTFKQLKVLPSTEEARSVKPEDRIIHMHFFLGGCDWYAAGFDPDTHLLYGFVILNSDYECGEWGDFSFDELIGARAHKILEIDRDLYWTPKRAINIDNICKCHFNGFKEVTVDG